MRDASATLGSCDCYYGCGASGRWEARTTAVAFRASYEAFSSLIMCAQPDNVKPRAKIDLGNFLGLGSV